MHILSGLYKNRPVVAPALSSTHPMGSREKLALFNMLSPYLSKSVVLDAFAGSGALGLEALSRGARAVVFVEKNQKCVPVIKKNLQRLDLPPEVLESVAVLKRPVESLALADFSEITLASSAPPFSLILADPPYDIYSPELVAPLADFLQSGGILALSSPASAPAPTLPSLELLKSNSYASARLSLFSKI